LPVSLSEILLYVAHSAFPFPFANFTFPLFLQICILHIIGSASAANLCCCCYFIAVGWPLASILFDSIRRQTNWGPATIKNLHFSPAAAVLGRLPIPTLFATVSYQSPMPSSHRLRWQIDALDFMQMCLLAESEVEPRWLLPSAD
jgi:hypothetical protein